MFPLNGPATLKRTARTSGLEALLLGLALGACASTSNQTAPTQDVPQHLVQLMHESAEAWNRGDLNGFLITYADDPQTVFMGNPPTLGLADIRDRYQRTYFKDGRPRDHLGFDELVTRMLGPDHALMRGRCILTNPADNSKTYCRYSLIWERRPEGWRIIHDHSS